MRKVIVIGCPGAGKTTFAKKLHEATGLPLIHLDAVWHRPDMTTIGRESFDAFLRSVMEGNAWILDGNYVRTLPMRLRCCDTVFFLDYSTDMCLAGAEERVGRQRDDIPWTEEALNEEFRKKILSFHTDTHPVICSMLEEEQRKGEKDVFVFRSRDEADAFLSSIHNPTTESFIENELYTDSINDLLVKCADFMIKHPKNSINPKIERVRLSLASVHRLSRIFTDKEHRDMWDRQIEETKELLKRAEAEEERI